MLSEMKSRLAGKQFFAVLLILLPLSILYSQDTINVPGDYSTIQAAINAANNGDIGLGN